MDRLTFQRLGKEVACWLVLLHMVSLHYLPLFIQTKVPAPTRLLLSVDHGGVGHVVVLKHRLFELTLRGEVFLRREREREGGRERRHDEPWRRAGH